MLALQGVFKDKNKIEQLFVYHDVQDILRTFKADQKQQFEKMKRFVFDYEGWSRLEVFILSCELSLSALRLADQDAATLPFVAEAYYKTCRETSLQLQVRATVSQDTELRNLLLSAATQITRHK